MTNIYGVQRADLLGGLVGALTDGRVNKVTVSAGARTGMAEFSTLTGKPQRVILPRDENLPEGFNKVAARGLVDHESSHVLHTTINVKDLPNPLEAKVENILEDPRIEALMMKRYPGSVENIQALTEVGNALVLARVQKAEHPLDLALLGISMMAYGQNTDCLSERPNGAAILRVLEKARPHVVAALASRNTAGVLREARAILALLGNPDAAKPAPQPKQWKGGKGKVGEGDPTPGEGTEPVGEGSEPETQTSQGGAGTPEDEDSDPASAGGNSAPEGEGEGDPEVEPEGEPEGKSEGEPAEEPDGEPTGDAPEGDPGALAEAVQQAQDHPQNLPQEGFTPSELVHDELRDSIEKEIFQQDQEAQALELLQALRSGLSCPVHMTPRLWRGREREFDVRGVSKSKSGRHDAIREMVRPVVMGLRHVLRGQLMAEGRTRTKGDQLAGELNPRALYHVAQSTSSKVFQVVTKGKSRRTNVSLLVDLSGSMNGAKVEQAIRAAVALDEALKGLPGIATEVLGFSAPYGAAITHWVGKSFKDKSSIGVSAFESGGGNADGSAVRWAARRSLAHKADRRILIVLSDGLPSDGPSPAEDLRAAVDACERNGVECLGIGIQDRSVTQFYPKHVLISRVGDLAGGVLASLANLLKPKAVGMSKALARRSA